MKSYIANAKMIPSPTGTSRRRDFRANALLMLKIGAIVAFLISGVSLAQSQDVAGDWQGVLNVGTTKLHVILHIAPDTNGNLQATMDGVPVSSISLKNSKLKFDVDKIQGSYVGKLGPDAAKISGTWSQGGAFFDLDFKRASATSTNQTNPAPPSDQAKNSTPALPSDIDGTWLGTIEASGIKLRVVFHILNTTDGLTATMDSPDQGVNGVPATAVTRKGSSLTIAVKQMRGGAFEGKISSDLSTIDGTYTWNGGGLPLVLRRVRVKDASTLEHRRPQNPVKPYPYREEEVSYDNKQAQGVTLAGTLTVPRGKGPFSAVLLVPGSGPHDRDETLLGHKPFLVLADYLTRKGIVVLRVDDRGVGKSTGDRTNATTADFATDAEAGVAYLKTRSEVDPHKIGLIGHSEGGLIAPMVAASDPDVAFIVMMAGLGVPGDEVLLEQGVLISEAAGASPAAAEKAAAARRELFMLIKQEKDNALLEQELREKLAGQPEAQINVEIKAFTSPWFRYLIAYDPAPALRNVKCPVLAINGEKDLQVAPNQNLPAIRKALTEGGNQHVEIDELPSLNHLFQTAKTGAPTEYGEIEETMSPVAMEKIASWILMEPKPAGVFNGRDTAYSANGDPKAATEFNRRGVESFAKGDYGRAIQDYTEAIRLDPKTPRAILNRGMANLYTGRFSDAQQDLSQNLRLDQTDLYAAIWLYLSRAKGGADGNDELKTNSVGLNLSKWPGPVIQLYLGQSTPEDVLRAAGSDSDQKCEYNFYVGEYRLLRSERPEALALFRTARDGCPKDFVEYVPSLIELNDLEKQR